MAVGITLTARRMCVSIQARQTTRAVNKFRGSIAELYSLKDEEGVRGEDRKILAERRTNLVKLTKALDTMNLDRMQACAIV